MVALRLDHSAPVDRAAIIGDIHGRSDLLGRLLNALDDRAVFVLGDLCDRGPDTPGVFDLLIERGAGGVRGNHEEWFGSWSLGDGFDDFALSPMVGGVATLAAYGVEMGSNDDIARQSHRVPAAHREWLAARPHVLGLEVRSKPWWLIHAGLPPVRGPLPQTMEAWMELAGRWLLWSAAPIDARPPTEGGVLMGHVRVPVPRDLGHVVALDTGCGTVPEGGLSACLLPEREFVTVGPG